FSATPTPIVSPSHAGQRGHPIALAWPLADEILRLRDDESLKTLVERHEVREIECNATVLGDLDTPDDYRLARERYGA
ncbi:MAG: hypothetical protein WD875_18120, partial [Pirellulales bacterium]